MFPKFLYLTLESKAMSDSIPSDFLKTLLASLDDSMRRSDQNIIERMDRVESSLQEQLKVFKFDFTSLQRNISDLDKQMVLVVERQNKINEFDQKFVDFNIRIDKIEQELERTYGAITFLKWLVSIAVGSGLVTVVWEFIIKGAH